MNSNTKLLLLIAILYWKAQVFLLKKLAIGQRRQTAKKRMSVADQLKQSLFS